MICESLSTSELGIRGTNGTGCHKDRTIPIKHHERCVLIRQPTQRSKGENPVRSDYDKTAKTMSDTRESGMTADSANPVLNQKMPAIYMDMNAVSKKSHNPMSWSNY
jgi:hypothetical protein